ncbi:MAG: DegV family protein [Tumebacillaceae bacterium]
MGKIAIVTDSTAYLPQDTIHKYDITVIPLAVNFGQESYKEGVEIVADQFFARLASEKALPTTSQPAVGEVVQAFERLAETHESIIGIFLSEGLSGTANSAETAARMVGGDISVIDSKMTAAGQAHLVLTACKMREEGASKEAIVDRLMEIRHDLEAFFIVDSLEHLHRGGRVSGISAMVGSLLQVKPILTVNDGKLELHEKIRTRKKAIARVFELVRASKDAGQPLEINVVYTDNREDALALLEQTKAEFPNATVNISQLGPVVGTHVGPGLLALIFYPQA